MTARELDEIENILEGYSTATPLKGTCRRLVREVRELKQQNAEWLAWATQLDKELKEMLEGRET